MLTQPTILSLIFNFMGRIHPHFIYCRSLNWIAVKLLSNCISFLCIVLLNFLLSLITWQAWHFSHFWNQLNILFECNFNIPSQIFCPLISCWILLWISNPLVEGWVVNSWVSEGLDSKTGVNSRRLRLKRFDLIHKSFSEWPLSHWFLSWELLCAWEFHIDIYNNMYIKSQ